MRAFKALLIIFILTSSCSKDVSFDSPIQAGLKGTWIPLLYTYEGHKTVTANESFEFQTFSGFGWEMNYQMTFGENPNDYSLSGNFFLDHTLTTDEGQSYLITSFITLDDFGSWSLESNDVTVIIDGEERLFTISELTDTSLVLRRSRTFSEVADDNVTTTETSLNEEYILERLH